MSGQDAPLAGGMANAGAVVRVGDTVRRPPTPHDLAVRALLEHCAAQGFDGLPHWLGTDDQGRTVVSWIEGDVGVPPYPAWVADDALLDSVADLQRRYHRAVAGFRPPPGATWDVTLAGPGASPDGWVVGHNDLCVENVVTRGGPVAPQSVAFIDFDFAAPVDPLWDVAVAIRHWAPVRHPGDLDQARSGVDQVARIRRYADVYGVPVADRTRLVDLLGAFLVQALAVMSARYEAGLPAYVAAWDAGYEGQNLRAQEWLVSSRRAITGSTLTE